MGTALDLSLEHGAGVTVVHCRGEIDLDSRDRLARCLRGLAGKVEVDLSGVTFLDSCGISTLVTAHNAAPRCRRKASTLQPAAQCTKSARSGRPIRLGRLDDGARKQGPTLAIRFIGRRRGHR